MNVNGHVCAWVYACVCTRRRACFFFLSTHIKFTCPTHTHTRMIETRCRTLRSQTKNTCPLISFRTLCSLNAATTITTSGSGWGVGCGVGGIGEAHIAQHGILQWIPNSSKATHGPAPTDIYTPSSARQMRPLSKQLFFFLDQKENSQLLLLCSGSNSGLKEVRDSLCYMLAKTSPKEVALVKGGAGPSSGEVPVERASRG